MWLKEIIIKIQLLTCCLKKVILILMLLSAQVSCKKFAELPVPTDRIAQVNVYNNNTTAIAVLTGIYSQMSSNLNWFNGKSSISLLAGLSSDEFSLFSVVSDPRYIGYYRNNLSVKPAVGIEFWSPFYAYVRKCNDAIEGLQSSQGLTLAVKQQLTGEAKFMRAFFYFYLVNLFGDVPIVTTTDYNVNTLLSRAPKTDVYNQIINDLKDAKELLSSDYLDGSLKLNSERIRPTKWTAIALLSRAYLYSGDFINAEIEASTIINNSTLFSLLPLNFVFLKNSKEAIWQLQPTTLGFNTYEAVVFILPSTGPNNNFPISLSKSLLNSFEANDNRNLKGNWVDSINVNGTIYVSPYKYKINQQNSAITSSAGMNEYLMVLRLSEQYLIRAEARAQLNNITGAQSDLNAIRNRAALGNTAALDKSSLLGAILHERQVELFSEWGHRWFDLKRTNNVDAVMSAITPLKANGAAWRPYQQLYPIPLSDLQNAPNLIQNFGY